MISLLILLGIAATVGVVIAVFGKDILEWGEWFLR